jgi:hypothetical protein
MFRLISIIANYSNEGHLCQFNLSKPNTKVDPKVLLLRRIETNNCKPSQHGGTECIFKFGSWTYSGDSIDLQLRMEEVNLSEYKEHLVYNLVNATAERNEIFYSCCPESYPDVTYKINLQSVQPKVDPKVLLLRQVSPYQYYKQRY